MISALGEGATWVAYLAVCVIIGYVLDRRRS